jgi:hypothetical protein
MATPCLILKNLTGFDPKTKNGVAIFSFKNPYWV